MLVAPVRAQVVLLFNRSDRNDEARRKEYEECIRAMEEIAAKKKQKDADGELGDEELPATPLHRIKAAAAAPDTPATANRMATATSATPFLLDANGKTSSVANLQSPVDGAAGSPGEGVAKGKGGAKVHAEGAKLRKRVGQSGEGEGEQQGKERDHAIVEVGDVALDVLSDEGSEAGSGKGAKKEGKEEGMEEEEEEEEEPKKPLLKRMYNLIREDAAFK